MRLCKRLKTPGIFNSYERITRQAQQEGMSYIEFLLEILESEVQSRESRNIVKKIKRAGFPTPKRFEELNEAALPEDARKHLKELKSLKFLSENRNLILLGNSGTGKTHLATAIGIKACEEGYNVLFKTAAGLINELKEAKDEKQLVRYAKQFKKLDLVIIDELGYISFDIEGAELLFQYLAMRYETKSTLITTNLVFSEWIKIFHDKALTMALLDRITHNAVILNMSGRSYRRRDILEDT
ncbi:MULTISPECIES: IS21-like element ISKol1 family helper ATPase IstB [Kosmotoga]|uniref:IstB domain protein ATP-binding protein n=1 Tax=Kosmotoga olearia (strain ATCC BAA-1733 / DSM 21960 / TBF 19.5.1) TaxID=521045 RepID=C5CHT0_KOSOT|nr:MULTISPECIES: IS21-like element ISKol1 family helper ATPase IstB [Kosmotoga]ACR78786.1 IstB domain protein ATP-binding protein [Kosmotoga olearia TBF 19.5.1]OAA19099.1 ATP-binding protein [Kosmotoga sp. DU53]